MSPGWASASISPVRAVWRRKCGTSWTARQLKNGRAGSDDGEYLFHRCVVRQGDLLPARTGEGAFGSLGLSGQVGRQGEGPGRVEMRELLRQDGDLSGYRFYGLTLQVAVAGRDFLG
jgi:hypothetical protein